MWEVSNSIEGPKRRNVQIILKQLALKYNVKLVKLISTDIKHDFLDRLLGIKREFIEFTAQSQNKLHLENFSTELQNELSK